MNLEDYPTPETDAIVKGAWMQYEKACRNLERRLTMCRFTLKKIAAFNDPVTPECKNPTMKPTRQWAEATIEATAP